MQPGKRHYRLSPSASELTVQVFKDTSSLAARLSHDHVIQASQMTGVITWSDNASDCVVDVRVPILGLRVDPPHLRERLRLGSKLTDKDKRETDKNMRAKSQLWSDRFPVITVRSTSCAPKNGGLRVTFDMCIRGRTVSRAADLTVTLEGDTLTAAGSFKARATDFGFKPFSALLGALKNQDEMLFSAKLVGSAPQGVGSPPPVAG
jgi:polyisoprenoid-binding protein YceI